MAALQRFTQLSSVVLAVNLLLLPDAAPGRQKSGEGGQSQCVAWRHLHHSLGPRSHVDYQGTHGLWSSFLTADSRSTRRILTRSVRKAWDHISCLDKGRVERGVGCDRGTER